jgi:hypothetical protein
MLITTPSSASIIKTKFVALQAPRRLTYETVRPRPQ